MRIFSLELRLLIIPIGVIAYVVSENMTNPWLNLRSILRNSADLLKGISQSKTLPAPSETSRSDPSPLGSLPEGHRSWSIALISGRLRNRRLARSIAILVIFPIALLLFLQMTQKIVAEAVPTYIRGLGTVTEIQGQVFLIDLAAIIVVLALIIYAVTSIFGVLTETKPG